MSTEKEQHWLSEIVENIDRVNSYVAGMTAHQFTRDQKTVDAVERCLQRITENAIRLADHGRQHWMPQQEWGKMRGLGNLLRHRYESLELPVIWQIIEFDFPFLRADCERTIERLRSGELS